MDMLIMDKFISAGKLGSLQETDRRGQGRHQTRNADEIVGGRRSQGRGRGKVASAEMPTRFRLEAAFEQGELGPRMSQMGHQRT